MTDEQPDLLVLAEARGVSLAVNDQGEHVGSCPFCTNEHALTIDADAQSWRCIGTCQDGGGLVEWVARARGVSRRHARELVRAGLPEGRDAPPGGRYSRQKGVVATACTRRWLDGEFDPDASDGVLLGQVTAFYHANLESNPEATGYLERRGLGDPELIEHFQLGYSNRTLGYRLPSGNRKLGAALRGRLRQVGVYRPNGREHLSGCVVVPVVGEAGETVQIYGRRTDDRARKGADLHLWLLRPNRPLFNPAAFASPTVILTASILDALTLWTHGQRDVAAIAGLGASTDDVLAAIGRHRTDKLILAFRRSAEGDQAAQRLAGRLAEMDVELHRMVLPAGKDCNDVGRTAADPKEAFAELLRNTEWIGGKPARLNAGSCPAAAPEAAADEASAAPSEPSPVQPDSDDERVLHFDDRRWRVRGLSSARARGTLKLNLFVSRQEVGFHCDVFDLYSARHRTAFVRLAAAELSLDEPTVKKDLGKVLLEAELAQDDLLQRLQAPAPKTVEMTDEDREDALTLLRRPNLVDRLLDDFERVGLVGERDNLLAAFLVTISRKLSHPLAALVQSSSAAGKSSLLSAVLDFVPDEDRVVYSAMTGQSLYYVGANDLRHKVLSIAEEQGATRAAYSLKLLQSDGTLAIASTGKESGTGRLVSHEYKVHGPLALMMTTTKVELDGELLNRCLVIAVDESAAQTERIQERQRWQQTLEGLLASGGRSQIFRRHHNAQRLLRPVRVVNPLTTTMSYGDLRVRARRDHQKLLSLIEALALLHQHQRKLQTAEVDGGLVEYVQVEPTDIETAERLMAQVGTIGTDDLPPHSRRVLELLDRMVAELSQESSTARTEIRFSRRQARERLGLGDTQLWVHLQRLVATEYLVAHPSRRGRGVVYELAYCGDTTTDVRLGSGQFRPGFGPDSGPIRPPDSEQLPSDDEPLREAPATEAHEREQGASPSERDVRVVDPGSR